jgi:hypothetical protein
VSKAAAFGNMHGRSNASDTHQNSLTAPTSPKNHAFNDQLDCLHHDGVIGVSEEEETSGNKAIVSSDNRIQ